LTYVTNSIDIAVEPTGTAKDPFGNDRAGFEGTGELSRKDYGLVWNVALETGGFLVSDNIKLQLDISAIKQ
jgi:polyisoprenoid-binding protein YceI